MKKLLILIGIFALIMPLMFLGCEGDDGAAGAPGADGSEGPAGPVTTTNESCVVCHGAGKIGDVAENHPDPAPEIAVTIPNTTIALDNGFLVISFHVDDPDGDPLTTLTFADCRFYLADIVPAGIVEGGNNADNTWSTAYLQRWAYERSGSGYPQGTFQNLTNGNYSYTMATAWDTPAAIAVPADDGFPAVTVGEVAPDFDPLDVQRVLVRVDARSKGFNRTVAIQDFQIDNVGVVTYLDPQRVLAPADGCKKCHSPEFQGAAHAGGYQDTRSCVFCHSPITGWPEDGIPANDNVYNETLGEFMQISEAWLSRFIHKIHKAVPNDEWAVEDEETGERFWESRIGGRGYEAVSLPQPVNNCKICHTGNGNMTNAYLENPTIEVCGSCHYEVNFATGDGHGGGAQANNSNCASCHPATGAITSIIYPVATVHAEALIPSDADTPEFDVTISLSPEGPYAAGDNVLVTVTLKPHGDNNSVDPSVYTAPKDSVGVSGGGLSTANLYVYGPRAKAVPVLTTGSTTDPANPGITQSHPLFVGGTDPLVATDNTGFKYQLLTIPTGMKAGTYMVRFEGLDYGPVAVDNYVTASSATITFQIGTATVEKKVAGDGCLDCHGDTRMHLTGLHPHNAPFDTDDCLACHDHSGGYGVPIANRVHAVHSANSGGDLYNIRTGHLTREWEEVTYPQDPERCVTCHASGNTSFKTNPISLACSGCHVEEGNAVLDHIRQNGGIQVGNVLFPDPNLTP